VSVSRWVILAAVFFWNASPFLMTDSVSARLNLFEEIGIGANWGPHWASGTAPSQADVRDTQDDGAFPAELCLVANAGFKTIRMYGENMETWIAVLDAVDDYNKGKLNCTPSDGPAQACGVTKPCMSVVYQVSICGPDPRFLTWNGLIPDDNMIKVPCYGTGATFAQSVLGETAKLRQILRYAGDKFVKWVPLVIIGNEILYSRGVCYDNASIACTQDNDCAQKCNIQHFCQDQLSSNSEPVECSSSASCQSGTCTDVTNFAAIEWAFDQIKATLGSSLPTGAAQPYLTISLQADVLSSPAFGDNATTAPLMDSRQLVKNKLSKVGNVLAVNVYPDQWGMVLQASANSYLSCITETNAVFGDNNTLPPQCASSPDSYLDPRTGLIAHSIASYLKLFSRYYSGLDVLITETGWHTDGTCSGYNDSTSTYSPAQAAAYYSDLYKYLQGEQTPLLVFELFDQKTKSCTTSAGPPAEANYGIFNNYCQLKGERGLYASLLPPGANLQAFKSMLDNNGSCDNQTLITVLGNGDNGVCYHNPELACISGYPEGGSGQGSVCPPGPNGEGSPNPCVWGVCADRQPSRGCNPDDPSNALDGCKCVRSGVCANNSSPAGAYFAQLDSNGIIYNPACLQESDCDDAIAPFTTVTCKVAGNCGCYAELAPSTVFRTIPDKTPVEGPGFKFVYQPQDGAFQFTKARTVSQKILGEGIGIESSQVETVWANIFMGKNWILKVMAPQGSIINGSTPEKSIKKVTPGPSGDQVVTWDNSTQWEDYSYGGMQVTTANNETEILFPRSFLTSVPSVPVTQSNLAPHQPNGWSDKLVIKQRPRASIDQNTYDAAPKTFYTTNPLRVDWAIINNGDAPTPRTFQCALLVDGVVKAKWKRSSRLKPGSVMSAQDVPLGYLSAGTHRIQIVADSTGVVQESDETDNRYTRTVTVIAR